MNRIDKLFREATGFHKATCLLASKYTGIKDYDPESHLPFPNLYRDEKGVLFRSVFTDNKADAEWTEDKDSYFTSLMVNGSFSLELHLKHLHMLIEGNQVRGHDLHKLFLDLPEWTQKELEGIFQTISKSQPLIKQGFDAINQRLEKKRSWTIESVLKETARAFEVWRYCFEDKGKTSSFIGYGEAVFSMRIISTQYKKVKGSVP